MKNVSTYLNVISTVLFLGAFIALLFKPTIKQYKYIVMAYAAGVIATILGDIINIVIGPHVMNYFLIVYYVLIVVVDGALTAIAVMLFKAYLKAYQMYEEWEPVDKEQEWVLAEVGAVEYGGVPRTQFVSEAVPLKKGSYTATSGLSSAQVFVSARDARKYKRTHRVPESYIPVPKAFFTN